MRLLLRSETGKFTLTKELISDDQTPPYAILSHTWGLDNEEVTFEDMENGTAEDKSGNEKIRFCGEQARQDGLLYFWVDTCCINKGRKAELSRSINSTFRWCRNATRCYVYLSDVSSPPVDANNEFNPRPWESDSGKADGSLEADLRRRRTIDFLLKGEILQELLAPAPVEFFSRERKRFGDKSALRQKAVDKTDIDRSIRIVVLYFDAVWKRGRRTRYCRVR